MLIKTFGSEQGEEQTCNIVNVCMKTLDGNSIGLPLFTVSHICDPLSNQPIAFSQSRYDQLDLGFS